MPKDRSTWIDDNEVDFSRKTRVYRNNRLIGKEYERFSCEDATAGKENWTGNPSVNKKTYELSSNFEDELNDKKHLLNLERRKPVVREALSDFFDEKIEEDRRK